MVCRRCSQQELRAAPTLVAAVVMLIKDCCGVNTVHSASIGCEPLREEEPHVVCALRCCAEHRAIVSSQMIYNTSDGHRLYL